MTSSRGPRRCGSDPAGRSPKGGFPWLTSRRSRGVRARPPWRQIGIAGPHRRAPRRARSQPMSARNGACQPPFGPARNGLIPYDVERRHLRRRPRNRPEPARGRRARRGLADPGFSPDGTRIGFIRTTPSIAACRLDIFVVRPDGSDLRRDHDVTASRLDAGSIGRRTAGTSPSSTPPTVRSTVLDHRSTSWQRAATLVDRTCRHRTRRSSVRRMDGRSCSAPASMAIRVSSRWTPMAPTSARSLRRRAARDGPDLSDAGTPPMAAGSSSSNTPPREPRRWMLPAVGDGRRWLDVHQFVSSAGGATWERHAVVSPDGKWIAFWQVFGTGDPTRRGRPGGRDRSHHPDRARTSRALPIGSGHPTRRKILMFPRRRRGTATATCSIRPGGRGRPRSVAGRDTTSTGSASR